MEIDRIQQDMDNVETEKIKWFDARMRVPISQYELQNDCDYKKPYLILFNAITSALDAMECMNFGKARDFLQAAQWEAEEAYISFGEEQAE